MQRRFILLILSVAVIHFSLSVALFLMFGIGLEDRSFGSDVFWYFQQPILGLTLLGLMPDFKLMTFPLNSILWGCIISFLILVFRRKR